MLFILQCLAELPDRTPLTSIAVIYSISKTYLIPKVTYSNPNLCFHAFLCSVHIKLFLQSLQMKILVIKTTRYRADGIRYRAVTIYNELSEDLRSERNINKFKMILTMWLKQ